MPGAYQSADGQAAPGFRVTLGMLGAIQPTLHPKWD